MTVTVGDFTITRIEEMLPPGFDPAFLFPRYDPGVLARHPQLASASFFDAASGKVMSSMQSWLIRGRGVVMLVDTGCGNDKVRSAPAFKRFHKLRLPFLQTLAAAGVRPSDVTHVFNTHLHVDHVGWNTRLDGDRWVPTFETARYIWGRVETDHWLDPQRGLRVQPEAAEVIEDSIRPIHDAGIVDFVEDGASILPGMTVRAAPGHTVGQLELWLRSNGEAAVFSADVLHQPMQVYRPDWNSCFCELQSEAVDTRRRLLADATREYAIVFPSHFGAPHAGRIAREGEGYAFAPLSQI